MAAQIAGLNVIMTTPEPLPSGGQFPIEFVLRSTADHSQMVEFANQLVIYANSEANDPNGAPTFYFADSDLKFDLPQFEIDIDKDLVAADEPEPDGCCAGSGFTPRRRICQPVRQ